MRAGQFRIPEKRRRKPRKAPAGTADRSARSKRPLRMAGALALVALAVAGVAVGFHALGGNDLAGAILGRAQEGKTREEIQAELNEEVMGNMMTVSILPSPRLDTTGRLTVGFENDKSNKFDQRFTLSQGDDVIYESAPIAPGERIDAVRVDGVQMGTATVEVQAVDSSTGDDHGSPTAVQVSVIEDTGSSQEAATSTTR